MRGISRREFSRAMAGSAGFGLLGNDANAEGPSSRAPAGEDSAARGPALSAANGSITDVPGIKAGHFTDSRRPTGARRWSSKARRPRAWTTTVPRRVPTSACSSSP